MCVFTLRRSRGRRANTAAVQLMADRNLWCTAGRLQEIGTAQGQNSTNTKGCLGRDREPFFFKITVCSCSFNHCSNNISCSLFTKLHMATLQLTGMSWDPKTNVSVIQHHKKKRKKKSKMVGSCQMTLSLTYCCRTSIPVHRARK